nr:immunoglobulin light chain junction region [Macaca mulatta]
DYYFTLYMGSGFLF